MVVGGDKLFPLQYMKLPLWIPYMWSPQDTTSSSLRLTATIFQEFHNEERGGEE
jgi:hypothetical protein